MTTGTKRMVALFVERSYQQWVVRDPEGNFWLLPSVEDPWGQRQPFYPRSGTRAYYESTAHGQSGPLADAGGNPVR